MSQPPGGQQPEGVPGYAPPQDPWGNDGFETGVASVPTDPIPQYSSSYVDLGYPTQPAWQQGQSYPYVPQQPPKSKAAPVILTILAVLVVGGGGGYGAWYFATHRGTDTPTNSPSQTASSSSTARPWDIGAVLLGDCIGVDDANTDNPKPHFETCGKGAFQVSAIRHGADIAQDGNGKLSTDEAQKACTGTDYTNFYAFDAEGSTANDYVLCLKKL